MRTPGNPLLKLASVVPALVAGGCRRARMLRGLGCAAWLVLGGCLSGGDALLGLAVTNPNDRGPKVRWDSLHTPMPEVPFPNDVATRPDATSASGRRVNIPTAAPTRFEAQVRRLMSQLDGFGTYAPLWLSFDAPIDLNDLYARQNDVDTANDAIYVVNLNPASARFGEPVLLDFGSGRFQLGLERSDQFFGNDPRRGGSNLVLETADEDQNGDGILQEEEDTDDDGILDRPNVWGTHDGSARTDGYSDLLTFYELESDTLLFRPVLPLEPLSTYAVIVTRRLVGRDTQSPVRSPFVFVNHTQQTRALRPLVDDGVLAKLGLSLDDVALTWSFTTQSVGQDLDAVREGLYGRGPFARLGEEFPAVLTRVHQADEVGATDNVYILGVERLVYAFENSSILSIIGQPDESKAPLAQSYRDYVDYVVFAELESPAFLDNDDAAFQIDRTSGEANYGRASLYLFCAVPKASAYGGEPPFPVIVYAHGTASSRLEIFGYAGFWAGFGFATCAVDMYGHGLFDGPELRLIAKGATQGLGLDRALDLIFQGRARDLNNDGVADPGGDFWTANIFHTRDVVRQSAIDVMQTVRTLRAFGSGAMPVDVNGDGVLELAGDFNGDGVVDFGGPQDYFMAGGSLGGIMTSLVGALEPSIKTLAPSAGGAGLGDIAVRSVQQYALEAIWMPILGPITFGQPIGEDTIQFAFDALDVASEVVVPFARVPSPGAPETIQVGDRVRITNLDNGEFDEVVVRAPSSGPPGQVRLQVGADKFDRVAIELFRKGASTPYRRIDTFEREARFQGKRFEIGDPLVFLQDGYGYRRGSQDLRRLTSLAQMVVDPADPANYAHRWHRPTDGAPPKNVLVVVTPGDMNVPVNTGVAQARTAGFYDPVAPDPRYGMSIDELLVTTHVLEGLEKLRRFEHNPCHYAAGEVLFDIDEASQGLDAEQGPHLSTIVRPPACDGSPSEPAYCVTTCVAREPLRLTVETASGQSGLRLPYIEPTGIHGYDLPNPTLDFDYHRYQIQQIGWFFKSQGALIVDAPCLASAEAPCDFLPTPPATGEGE